VLLHDERNRAEHPLLEALLEAKSGDRSPVVRQAAESLLQSSAPWSLEVDRLLSRLVKSCEDQRGQRLFVEWSLNRGQRPTMEALAARIGLSRRRTREIVDRSEARVRDALARAPAPVPWTIVNLRRRLGAITTGERAVAGAADLGLRSARAVDLALWLCGPYREDPSHQGWLVQSGNDVVARTEAWLVADGGVPRLVDVAKEIDPDMDRALLTPWLAACGGVVVGDVVVSVSGSAADVVERVLDAHGTSLTLDEIGRCAAGGGRDLAVDTLTVLSRNRRFRRDVDGRLALADWGTPAATCPGPQRPGLTQHDRPRPPDARRVTRPEPTPTAGHDDRLMLWVRIDAEALRGSESGVPLALVEGLGLVPGCQRTFASRYGPVTLAHDGATASRRSVRAVSLAAGAQLNDTLLLGFSARGDINVAVRRNTGDSDITDLPATQADFFPQSAISGAI